MKPRTLAIAFSFGRVVGLCAGTALFIVAFAETLNMVLCCRQSEAED